MVWYYIILNYNKLYHIILYHIMLCNILYYIVLYYYIITKSVYVTPRIRSTAVVRQFNASGMNTFL